MQFLQHFKLKDYLISILIIAATLLYFGDRYLGLEGVTSVSILGLEIGSFGFSDIESFVRFIKTKFLILLFATIWFLTCKHWWKMAILVIITIELVKVLTTLNTSFEKVDVVDYLISLPITIPFILMLLYISHKLNSYNLKKELRAEIDNEIDKVFFQIRKINIIELNELKISFNEVKNNKSLAKSEDYLEKLILIRNKFYNI